MFIVDFVEKKNGYEGNKFIYIIRQQLMDKLYGTDLNKSGIFQPILFLRCSSSEAEEGIEQSDLVLETI